MTEIEPTYAMEQSMRMEAAVNRVVSALVFCGFATMMYGIATRYPWGLVPTVVVLVFLLLSPLGSMFTFVTAWTGWWVESCPHCTDFSFTRAEYTYLECDTCRERGAFYGPGHKPGWVTRRVTDGPDEHYCCNGCAR